MKLSALFASLFAAAAVAQNGDFNGYKPITLKFHDAAFSYKLDMYADGNNYETSTYQFLSRRPLSYINRVSLKQECYTDNL